MSEPVAAIVLPTDAIGGAEKRLAELWVYLRKTRPTKHRLVVSRPLLEHLRQIADFRPVLDACIDELVVHEPSSAGRQAALRRLTHAGAVEVWHAVMVPPLRLGLTHPLATVFSVPIARLELLNLRGRMSVIGGAAFADRVDVLDPGLTGQLQQLLPWKREAIENTPGSQVDLEAYRPLPFEEKENTLVFCGLLSRAKNADRLLEALPELHAGLEREGLKNLRYVFLGRDTEELRFYERVKVAKAALPVEAWFEPNPARVLERAKVFFSVQPITNYPSKSLLEAMACGALPVVTDVGESRRIAQPEFAKFIRGDFGGADLISPCVELLRLPRAPFELMVERARRFVSERFSLEASARYYTSLYANAAAAAGH